jgi:hypothetical protein
MWLTGGKLLEVSDSRQIESHIATDIAQNCIDETWLQNLQGMKNLTVQDNPKLF